MSTCSIVNKETKEPIKYYRSDNGKIFTSLSKTLENSSVSYDIGFKNEHEEFVPIAKMAVHSQSTLKGKIQGLIKTQYFKPYKIGKDTYEAQDSLAAEMIEDEIVREHPFSYKRNGNEFTFYFDDNIPKTFEERSSKYGENIASRMGVLETYYQEKFGIPRLKVTRYTQQELRQAIFNFMEKVGISINSIERYSKNYNSKFNIEPDAKAFIDINNKIIAVANGTATTEELSEEVAHFIIEAWDQSEISRLLDYVPMSREYAQFHEKYTEIYSKQSSNPKIVEEYVRKEVLGKMLSNTFQNGFTINDKTQIEKNFFYKLGDILKRFFDFIKNKITKKDIDELVVFTNEINNLLFNDKLQEKLSNLNPISDINIMYNVGDTSELDGILDNIEKVSNQVMADGKVPTAILEGIKAIHNRLLHVNGLLNELKDFEKSEKDILDGGISMDIEKILVERESLDTLRTLLFDKILGLKHEDSKKLLTTVNDSSKALFNKLSILNGEYGRISKTEPSKAVDLWAKTVGAKDYLVKLVKDSLDISIAQEDANWFVKLFGHTGKTSNSLVNIFNDIGLRLFNETVVNNWHDTQKYSKNLIKNAETVNSFVEKGRIKSDVDDVKIEEDKKRYEYEIRKQINDRNIPDNVELFLEKYDSYPNINSSDYKSEGLFYKYDRLYKKNYSAQKFKDAKQAEYWDTFSKNMDNINASEEFYEAMIILSQQRYRSRQSKTSDVIERQDQTISRRKMSNIYEQGSSNILKRGLELKRFNELKENEDYATLNPRKEPTANDYVVVLSSNFDLKEIPSESRIAYDMLRWNKQLFESNKNNKYNSKDNFKIEYLNKKNELRKQGLSYEKFNKELKKWMDDNIQFDMVDEYWDSLTTTIIDTSSLSNKNRQDADSAIEQIKKLKLERGNILKVYKMIGDSREIIPENIETIDKHRLSTIDNDISTQYAIINKAFKDDNIDISSVYNSEKINPELNKSFYIDFENYFGIRYEDSTFEQKESFYLSDSDRLPSNKVSAYSNFKKALDRNINIGFFEDTIKDYLSILNLDDYRNVEDSDERRNIKEALLEMYLKNNIQSWYKRYDANKDYNIFLRKLDNGDINIEEILDNFINKDTDAIIYENEPIQMMKISPSFKYNSPIKRNIKDIYENDYLNPNKTDLEKWQIAHEMADLINVDNSYLKDRSDIKNNPEKLKLYIEAMDWHLNTLYRFDMLKSRYIFQQIQMPKTQLERAKALLQGENKKAILLDTLSRTYQYKSDELEDAYRQKNIIPKMGFVKLSEDEISNDWLASLAWGSYNSNLYQQRVEKYPLAQKIMSSFENLKFENGKKPTDTNYYKMMQEMKDYNFFGKTTTYKHRVKLPGGIEIDLAKVINNFRRFTITQALAFSPIVAISNVTAGVTNHQILKWVGKKIYKEADNRANNMITPLYGDSIRDIGSFDPQSRLNKILYSFGMYDIEKRFENAQFNKTARLIPNLSFGAMSIGNFSLQSKITLSKLMESRLINGELYTWGEYFREQNSLNPDITEKEAKIEFEKYSKNSMYDYLKDNGDFDLEKLSKDGFQNDINKSKARIMSQIRDISEQVTMEIHKANEGYAARDPLWSFVLSLKKWMVLANTTMFSKERVDLQTGGKEQGLIYALRVFRDIFKSVYKDQQGFTESYRGLEEHDRNTIKQSMVLTATLTAMLGLAVVMKGWGDDDDDENPNYLKQLSVYMMLRNLNEISSGTVGIGDSYYSALQNPIMTLGTIGNVAKLANLGNMNKTIESGKYAGQNKWISDAIKLTWLKNLYTFKDANTIRITREGYTYFNQENSLYNLFDLLPDKPKDDGK